MNLISFFLNVFCTLDQSKSDRCCIIKGVGVKLGGFFMLLVFVNEKEVPVCLTLGDALCLNQRTQLWDDMFGFSQQLNRPSARGMDSRNSPLSSAV